MRTTRTRSTASLRRLGRTLLYVGSFLAAGWASAGSDAPRSDARARTAANPDPWWQHAVIYEIYPRSFQDSNGDGIGDLNGITQRLDYLQALGVDAIWIAPMYPSPQVDFVYDISDYQNVDPQYGSLADFDHLVAEAGKRHIRVLLDMVLNHTSDQHPWFLEAARSRDSARHDFYCWNDGKPGPAGQRLPPNNWVSLFGGSAWQYLPAVGQFYYHMFYRQQPDLNWRNPHVERAMFAAMRFWLDRGVAGFRLDAITTLFEDAKLRDEPALGGRNAQGDPILSDLYTNNLPEVHGVIRRMRAMIDEYPGERVLIGETYVPKTADLDPWYGGALHNELQLPMDTLVGLGSKLDASSFRQHLIEAATQLHDSRPLLVTSRATALLYQGEEIGQRTATPTRVEDVRDPIGITGWPKEKGRDGERTPMQWDTSNAQAGFSTNPKTWLPVPPDYRTLNVQTESADPDSLLNWHRRLIALRRSDSALRNGRTVMLDQSNVSVLTYARVGAHGETILVSLNMSPRPQTITLGAQAAGLSGTRCRTLLSSPGAIADAGASQPIALPAFGAWVAALDSHQ